MGMLCQVNTYTRKQSLVVTISEERKIKLLIAFKIIPLFNILNKG